MISNIIIVDELVNSKKKMILYVRHKKNFVKCASAII